MRQLVFQEPQFTIATHSPILLAYPNAKILLLDQDGFWPVKYEETDHCQLTKTVLNDVDGMQKTVLSENDEAG
jgi:predicted ATPase